MIRILFFIQKFLKHLGFIFFAVLVMGSLVCLTILTCPIWLPIFIVTFVTGLHDLVMDLAGRPDSEKRWGW